MNEDAVPIVYPFLTGNGQSLKKKLIENKIYIASYCVNVQDWTEKSSFEYNLVENLLALPVDQRYDRDPVLLILDLIHK